MYGQNRHNQDEDQESEQYDYQLGVNFQIMTARLNMQANDNTGGNIKQYYSDKGEEIKDDEFKAVSNFLPDYLKEAYSIPSNKYSLQKCDNPNETSSPNKKSY